MKKILTMAILIFATFNLFASGKQNHLNYQKLLVQNSAESETPNDVSEQNKQHNATTITSDQPTSNGLSLGRYITSGVLGSVLGGGVGHFVQGRIGKGFLFLGSEIALYAIAVNADTQDEEDTALIATAGLLGVRAWEIIDVWTTPKRHGNMYYVNQPELKEVKQLNSSDSKQQLLTYRVPVFDLKF